MQDSSSDDELFGVGLGDLSVAVDDDSAASVAEPSSTELETFRAVELACLEGRRITTEAGAALAIANDWYAKIADGAYGAVIQDALLKAVVERPPLKVSAIADRCQALMKRRGGQARARAELTAAGAACLRLYQQSNYSGPLPSDETLKLVEGYAPKLLDVGGDAPSPFVAAPGALTLALALLEAANEGAASWWLIRAKTLHARCLVTGSHRVCGTFIESVNKHAAAARRWLEGASADTRALLELELGLAEHFLDEPGRGSVPASEFFTLRRPRRWRAGGMSHRVHFINPRRPRALPRGRKYSPTQPNAGRFHGQTHEVPSRFQAPAASRRGSRTGRDHDESTGARIFGTKRGLRPVGGRGF